MSGTESGIDSSRECIDCGEPISEKRLAAKPHAVRCVLCQEAVGDVPKIKAYDDPIGDGEDFERIYYQTPGPYLAGVVDPARLALTRWGLVGIRLQ
jgi:hypothetical protein